jgi:hypothetical protein
MSSNPLMGVGQGPRQITTPSLSRNAPFDSRYRQTADRRVASHRHALCIARHDNQSDAIGAGEVRLGNTYLETNFQVDRRDSPHLFRFPLLVRGSLYFLKGARHMGRVSRHQA